MFYTFTNNIFYFRYMKFYSTLVIGSFHTNHCEDFLTQAEISKYEKLVAVMDGCSMGTESVFSSLLIGKLLRKIAKNLFYQDFMNPIIVSLEDRLKEVVQLLFEELKQAKNQLGLDTNELLSTLIIGIVDTQQANAEFLTVGDGLIYYDGVIQEYEQDNKPDYLGYHLGEDFENWYNQQEQKLSINSFSNLGICTDGIFTLKNFKRADYQLSEKELITYLLEDIEYSENTNFLDRKLRVLKDEKYHEPTDDLAIIRILKK